MSERGSVTVIAAASCALVALVLALIAGLAQVRAERTRAQAVADLTAVLAGPHIADPCALAGQIAERNGARLTGCERLGADLRVRVEGAALFGFAPVSAAARAAPVTP